MGSGGIIITSKENRKQNKKSKKFIQFIVYINVTMERMKNKRKVQVIPLGKKL